MEHFSQEFRLMPSVFIRGIWIAWQNNYTEVTKSFMNALQNGEI